MKNIVVIKQKDDNLRNITFESLVPTGHLCLWDIDANIAPKFYQY